MTREEAIKRLEVVRTNALIQKSNGVSKYWQEEIDGTIEAIDMAIEALSADAVQRWIPCDTGGMPPDGEAVLISDGNRIWIDETVAWWGDRSDWIGTAWMPLPKPYKGGDTANYTAKKPNDVVEQGNDVVAEPTDLISRVDAIEAIESRQTEQWIDTDVDYNNGLESAVSEIKALPSADRPRGEWVIRENGNKECSLCGHERQDGWDYFCGYCGAKMGSDGLYYADNRLTVEWKLVSEELPQKVGSYIVTCQDEYGSVYVDYDFWTVLDEFKYNCSKVIAWIPFPKPYCGTKVKGEK